MVKMRDDKKIASKLLEIARESGKEAYNALNDFIDWLIDVFDVKNQEKYGFDKVKLFTAAMNENPKKFDLMRTWFTDVTDEMEKGYTSDWFGSVYESMFQCKGKASSLGQFYTPEHLCYLMAEMTIKKGTSGQRFNDCACGSGRTLLAAFQQAGFDKFNTFHAGDIDTVSCKMCALNMMIHGMIGEVKQQDALKQDTPVVIYRVNEVRYPFPFPGAYSIRRIYPKDVTKTEESVIKSAENGKNTDVNVQEMLKSVPDKDLEETTKKAGKNQRSVQLELF